MKTNKYAKEYIQASLTKKHLEQKKFSRLNRWKETAPIEIQKSCALHYLMGLVKLPSVKGLPIIM